MTAEDLGAAGAMTVLLKDAIKPNLIQTLEGQPCLMHAGPFANIAHGNSSLIADLLGLKLGEYVITESGFGSDMGMEKFIDIVCRDRRASPRTRSSSSPPCGRSSTTAASTPTRPSKAQRLAAIESGIANLVRHLGIVREFGLPAVVAVNRRPEDTDEEVELVTQARDRGRRLRRRRQRRVRPGRQGSRGPGRVRGRGLRPAERVPLPLRRTGPRSRRRSRRSPSASTAPTEVVYYLEAEQKIEQFTGQGLAELPVCMAKTPLSLSADPELLGAPTGFQLPVRDVRAYTGAGWLVPLCGDIQQMPGLGKTAAAFDVDIDAEGRTVGLF